jgi:hypothetical protein
MLRRVRFVGLAAVALVAVALAAASVGADEEVLLGYKFEEGYTKDYQVKINYEVDYGGWAFATIADMEVTERCVGVEDDLFLMEVVFNKVETARLQGDDMTEDPSGEHLTGQVLTYKVDAHGVVTEIKPAGYIEGWPQLRKMIEGVFENWYGYLPNESLAKGAKWTHETEPNAEETIKAEGQSDYEFKDVKEEEGTPCAHIEGKSKHTLSGTQETTMGSQIVEGEEKGDIELFFCAKSSTIVKFKAKSESKIDMTPEAGGDPVETTVNSTLERKVMS